MDSGAEKEADKCHEGFEVEILRRLPVNLLAKFSTVSKSWLILIKEPFFIDQYAPKLTGFFYQVKNADEKHNRPRFVPVQPGTAQIPDPGLNFLRRKNVISRIQVIDSCNGILLCTGSSVSRVGFFKIWFVCNPITMDQIALPYPTKHSRKAIYALNAGLSNNGISEFKVLCVFKGDPDSKLWIFSSKTGEWEDVQEPLPTVCENASMGSKVFFNNMLFWDCLEGKILISYLHSEDRECPFEVIDAPESPLGRFLCRMEDKIRCLCYGFLDKYPTMSISFDDFDWKKENCREFDLLSGSICGWLTMKLFTTPFGFRILAYAPESYMFYVCFARTIYSYDLRKPEFKPISGYLFPPERKFYSTTRIIPYLPNLARIQEWSCESESEAEADSVQEDSYTDILESASNITMKKRIWKWLYQ